MDKDAAIPVHGQEIDGDSKARLERMERTKNGVVFEGRHERPIPPAPRNPVDGQVQGVRTIERERCLFAIV
jgi:hypothetical protein